mmetsp:Transcript_5077/g.5866  ORF Transcript_5077/g.5866 Transcript_5077/m.5866 type:complete len:195 (+) Transcript_5077:189-773(+)
MSDPCATCGKPVYFNEKLSALNKTYHKVCFKCTDCEKRINLGQQLEHDELPFCKTCHQKNFGARGFRGGGSGAMVQGNFHGQAPVQLPSERWNKERFGLKNEDAVKESAVHSSIPVERNAVSYEAPPKNNPNPIKAKPAPTRIIEDTNERDDDEDSDDGEETEDMSLLEMIQNHEYYVQTSNFFKEKLGPYLGL